MLAESMRAPYLTSESYVGHPRPQGAAARVDVGATVEQELAHGQVARLRERLDPRPHRHSL